MKEIRINVTFRKNFTQFTQPSFNIFFQMRKLHAISENSRKLHLNCKFVCSFNIGVKIQHSIGVYESATYVVKFYESIGFLRKFPLNFNIIHIADIVKLAIGYDI